MNSRTKLGNKMKVKLFNEISVSYKFYLGASVYINPKVWLELRLCVGKPFDKKCNLSRVMVYLPWFCEWRYFPK